MTKNPITPEVVLKAEGAKPKETPAVYSGDEPVELQNVQYRGGYTFVYPVGPFCSARLHNDLREVQRRTGVQLSYINVSNPGQVYTLPDGDSAPGFVRSDGNSARDLSRLGLNAFDPRGALLDSRGRVVAHFQMPIFGGTVQGLVAEINSVQQGRSR